MDPANAVARKTGEISVSSIQIPSKSRESALPTVFSPTEIPKRQGSQAEVR
jgi:hypothetical protein